jgi:type IV secretion system protein TrbL
MQSVNNPNQQLDESELLRMCKDCPCPLLRLQQSITQKEADIPPRTFTEYKAEFREYIKKPKNVIMLILAIISLIFLVHIFTTDAFAADAASASQVRGIPDKIIEEFRLATEQWVNKLTPVAKNLFRISLTISIVCFGFNIALKQQSFHESFAQFAMMVVFSGFAGAVLVNYQEWTHWLINWLQGIGGSVGGKKVDALAPLDAGFEILDMIKSKMEISLRGLALGLGSLILGIIIIICFALISAQIVFVWCESYVACSAGIILLGMGGGGGMFKDYAINTMRYAFSVAFKLFVLQLLMSLGMQFIEKMAKMSEYTFTDIASVTASAIILLALVKSIPDVCAGLIQGSHIGSGASLGASVRTIVSAAAAMGAAAKMMMNAPGNAFNKGLELKDGASQLMNNLKTAGDIAKMEGSGVLGAGKALWDAGREVTKQGRPESWAGRSGELAGKNLATKVKKLQMEASKKTGGQGGA